MSGQQDENGIPLPWRQPGWREFASDWVRAALAARGMEQHSEGMIVKDGLWSFVMRVPASGGDYYFKAVGPRLRHEAALTDFLYRRFPEDCVAVVAHDAEQGWLLLTDAGAKYRETPDYAMDGWYELLTRYARLQIALTPDLDGLLATGTPDGRSPALPALYENLIADAFRLYADTDYRLTAEEAQRLRALTPTLIAACDELAASGIPASIDHGDLHGGNVFVREGIARFADWGDAHIVHPFVSALVPFNVFEDAFALTPDAPEVRRLRDAYLEPFEIFADRKTLLRAFDTARRVAVLFRALSWNNALAPLPAADRAPYAEHGTYWLREWGKDEG